MKILGIDPGNSTGLAMIRRGELKWLDTVDQSEVIGVIQKELPDLVVIEDSRLQPVFPRLGVSARAMLKVAANVGGIHMLCQQIEAAVSGLDIRLEKVSPLRKGSKINAANFNALTGWPFRSNQHERDAAMLIWRFKKFK